MNEELLRTTILVNTLSFEYANRADQLRKAISETPEDCILAVVRENGHYKHVETGIIQLVIVPKKYIHEMGYGATWKANSQIILTSEGFDYFKDRYWFRAVTHKPNCYFLWEITNNLDVISDLLDYKFNGLHIIR